MSYLNHSYNESPTIYGEVAAKVEAPAMLAFVFDENGKLKLPAADGDFCAGIALANMEEVDADGPLYLQVKDGCYWIVGEAVKRGDQLIADTNGKAKKGESGNVLAIALEDAEADKPCNVYILRSTLGAGGGGGSSYTLPVATASKLGGVKPKAKTNETVEVTVDAEGKLYAPAYPTVPTKATTAKEGTVKQGAAVADSSGATDTTLETKVNALLKSLRDAGIIASA